MDFVCELDSHINTFVRCLKCNKVFKGERETTQKSLREKRTAMCPYCNKRLDAFFEFEKKTITYFDKQDGISTKEIEFPIKYQINAFLNLRFEEDTTSLYIKDEYFRKCSYVLLGLIKNDKEMEDNQKNFECIDEAIDQIDQIDETLLPLEEFKAQCSNFQAFADYDYNTDILSYQLSFPLLKKLSSVGDPIAKSRFREEIIKRISSDYFPVIIYLLDEGYLDQFNESEMALILEDLEKLNNSYIKLFLRKRKYLKGFNCLFDSKRKWLSSYRFAIKIFDFNKSITSYDNFCSVFSFKDHTSFPRIRYNDRIFYDFNSSFLKTDSSIETEPKKIMCRNLLEYSIFWKIVNILDKNEDIMIYVPKDNGVFRFHSKKAGFDLILLPYELSETEMEKARQKFIDRRKITRKRKQRKKAQENEEYMLGIVQELRKVLRGSNFKIDKNHFLSKKLKNSIRLIVKNKEETDLMVKEDKESLSKIDRTLSHHNISVSVFISLNLRTKNTTLTYYIKRLYKLE